MKEEIIESVDLNTVKTENIVTLVKEEVNYDYIVEQKIKIDNFDWFFDILFNKSYEIVI